MRKVLELIFISIMVFVYCFSHNQFSREAQINHLLLCFKKSYFRFFRKTLFFAVHSDLYILFWIINKPYVYLIFTLAVI